MEFFLVKFVKMSALTVVKIKNSFENVGNKLFKGNYQ